MVNARADGRSDGNEEECTNDKADLRADGKEVEAATSSYQKLPTPTEEDESTIDDFLLSVDVVDYPITTTGCNLSSSDILIGAHGKSRGEFRIFDGVGRDGGYM